MKRRRDDLGFAQRQVVADVYRHIGMQAVTDSAGPCVNDSLHARHAPGRVADFLDNLGFNAVPHARQDRLGGLPDDP